MLKKNLIIWQAGFSLIEMMVVLFVVGVLCSILLFNYRDSQNKFNLNQAVQRFAADLRRAQNLALSGQSQGADIPLGYGVRILNNTTYFIFYNLNGGGGYRGSSVKLSNLDIVLSAGVTFTAGTNQDVYYAPPDPTTYINGSPPNSSPLTFTLHSGNYNQSVIVYDNGKINIQ